MTTRTMKILICSPLTGKISSSQRLTVTVKSSMPVGLHHSSLRDPKQIRTRTSRTIGTSIDKSTPQT